MDDAPTSRPSLPIRLAIDHPWRVIAGWLVILILAIVTITSLLGDAFNNDQESTSNPSRCRRWT